MNDTRQPSSKAHLSKEARLQSVLSGQPITGPQTVHFDLANGCNTRCTTCWHHSPLLQPEHRPTAAWRRRTMPLATWRALFDELLSLGGLEQIVLSGMGDPTLHPDLYTMVDQAHAEGIGVTIITNLLRLDVPRLLQSGGELHVLASICGVSEATWQAFHAHPTAGGFTQVLDRLEQLRDAGFRPKHVQVVNTQNVFELPDMVRFARRWPVERINFKLASLARGTEAVGLTEAQKAQLATDLIPRARGMALSYGIETDLDAFATQITPGAHRTAPIEQVGCFMGTLYARVTVDAEVLYCCNPEVSLGPHASSAGLETMWSGPAWQALRDRLRRGDYFPGCTQCGKYKQNVKWRGRLDHHFGAEAVSKATDQ